jgi:hypothetical protein
MHRVLKYAARISEAREQHQVNSRLTSVSSRGQMDEYYDISRLPI